MKVKTTTKLTTVENFQKKCFVRMCKFYVENTCYFWSSLIFVVVELRCQQSKIMASLYETLHA